MTDIIEETVIEDVALEDLDHFWMENGLPVFIANRDNICDLVENLGFTIYYLLGNSVKKTSTTNNQKVTTTTEAKSMQLYRVVNNMVGRTVSMSNEPFDNAFLNLSEEAIYSMPPIPHVMIDKLDQFFRLVDAQHGTESIVMLTYDMTMTGSEGWGILVPDQTNTSVHCNYDPHSIATIKPDNVMIVGSVHSHPGMSAYASGTDHKDQADFDGIHITFGWQKSVNNGATQYHIEMQMAGKAYTLQPEDVFEDYVVERSPDPEVVGWTDKVKKVLPPKSVGGPSQAGHTQAQAPTTVAGSKGPTLTEVSKSLGDIGPGKEVSFDNIRHKFMVDIDVEPGAIIVAEVSKIDDDGGFYCPLCNISLDDFSLHNGFCDFCYGPLAVKNSSYGSIITRLAYYCADVYIDTDVPVYLYADNGDNTYSLMRISENLKFDIQEEIRISQLDAADEENDIPPSFTLCCSTPLSRIEGCKCSLQVLPSDVNEFEYVTKSLYVYDNTSKCNSCEFYYDAYCPRYFNLIEKYVDTKNQDPSEYSHKINDEGCSDFVLSTYISDPLGAYYD